MTKADVVATLASPLNSFKIVNTTKTIGAFTEDRSSAIRGVPGESARMIPVAIHTHGGRRDRTLHMEVIDNPDITPGAIMVSLYESLLETNSYSEELTYELRGTVAIDGYPLLASRFAHRAYRAVALGFAGGAYRRASASRRSTAIRPECVTSSASTWTSIHFPAAAASS